MLTELKIKEIINFAKRNNLGDVVAVNYKPNCLQNYIYDSSPYSIEIICEKDNKTRSYIFSEHGLANIYDGKKSLYVTDSEERFSLENPEMHPITYAWVKLLGSLGNETYNNNEIAYRTKQHAKIDEQRKRYTALKSYYTSQIRKLEDVGNTSGKTYAMVKQEFETYTNLTENCSKLKQLQTKCIKALEAQSQM